MRCLVFCLVTLWTTTVAQISDPHASDDQLDNTNKFVQRQAPAAPVSR